MKVNNELINAIENTLTANRLILATSHPVTVRLVKAEVEGFIEKQEAWLATAKKRKNNLEKGGMNDGI
jgi:hypothetical protein